LWNLNIKLILKSINIDPKKFNSYFYFLYLSTGSSLVPTAFSLTTPFLQAFVPVVLRADPTSKYLHESSLIRVSSCQGLWLYI